MSEHDLTQDARSSRLQKLNEVLAASADRDKARAIKSADNIKCEKERKKRCAQFGWSDAQFAEYWLLRDVPAPDKNSPLGFSTRKSKYDLLVDRERKRLKAPPRTNEDLSKATADEKAARKRKQDREAKQRQRAKVAAEIAAEKEIAAAAAGERLLTDSELAEIEALEAVPDAAPTELDRMLASLRAAEAREGK